MRALLIASTLLCLALSLGGCGFQPLYARSLGVSAALASVAVETPPTRTGQLLREELEDEFARASATSAPRYRLSIDIQERRFPRGLRVDDTANRYELRLIVRYRLTDLTTGRLVTAASESVFATYDVADAPYAGIAANLDGQERAASEAARVIRTNISRVLAARQVSPSPPARPTPRA